MDFPNREREHMQFQLIKACYSNSPDDYFGIKISSIRRMIIQHGYGPFEYNYIKAEQWKKKSEADKLGTTFERWNRSTEWMLCEKILKKHLAIVSVMFDKETYVRTKTSLRVSFTDKLAAFGKLTKKLLIRFLFYH